MQTLHVLGKALLLSLAATATRTTSSTGSGVDMIDYEGQIAVVVDSSASAATGTFDHFLEECDTSGGTYTAVPVAALAEGAFTQVTNAAASQQVRHLDIADRKRFIRAAWTAGGGSPSAGFSVHVLAQKKYA